MSQFASPAPSATPPVSRDFGDAAPSTQGGSGVAVAVALGGLAWYALGRRQVRKRDGWDGSALNSSLHQAATQANAQFAPGTPAADLHRSLGWTPSDEGVKRLAAQAMDFAGRTSNGIWDSEAPTDESSLKSALLQEAVGQLQAAGKLPANAWDDVGPMVQSIIDPVGQIGVHHPPSVVKPKLLEALGMQLAIMANPSNPPEKQLRLQQLSVQMIQMAHDIDAAAEGRTATPGA